MREFLDCRSRLYNHGFDRVDVDKVAMIFRADLDEAEETQKGIDAGEIERGIAWMRKNEKLHGISSSKIDALEKILKEKL